MQKEEDAAKKKVESAVRTVASVASSAAGAAERDSLSALKGAASFLRS